MTAFIRQAPPIHTREIKQLFLLQKNYYKGMVLLSHLFFDRRQRAFPQSDLTRAQVIGLMPAVFNSLADQPKIISSLIQKLALLAVIEKALPPQEALITLCHQELDSFHRRQRTLAQISQNRQFSQLESYLKGRLAGTATACDPEFVALENATPPTPTPLTRQQAVILENTLKRLQQSVAPQIALNAHQALFSLPSLA
jgi:hypothetical protein